MGWYFCRRNTGETTAHDQEAYNYAVFWEGVENKQPSDFMEIIKMEKTWNCIDLQLS